MPVSLTPNAITAINAGDVNLKPLLQVLDIKMIGRSQERSQERYRLLISDGVLAQHAMIAVQLNDRVKSGTVEKGSIVQLIDYVCSEVKDRK